MILAQGQISAYYLDENDQLISNQVKSRLQLDNVADSLLINWINNGHISASLDSAYSQNDTLYYRLFKGEKFTWERLKIIEEGNILKNVRAGLDNRVVNESELGELMQIILIKCENRGYPFAKVRLSDIEILSNSVSASIDLELNELMVYDSVIVKGDVKISPLYLSNVLNIKNGIPYDESNIRNIGIKIKEVPFISSTGPAQFVFKDGKVDTYVYIEPKKANRFNGIIGFLPNSSTGKTNFTGEIDLSLINTFKAGEKLDFEWRRIQENVQELSAAASVPYLFNSPFGLEASLRIFRRDTLFLEVQNQLGLIYNFGSGDSFRAYYKSYSADNLGNDDEGNPKGGTNYDSYGLGLIYSDLDYRYNPRKGYFVNVSGDVGQKFIKSNTFADSIALEIPEKSTIYTFSGSFQYYIPSGKRSTWLISLDGSAKLNPYLISNELFRYGGINSLRGFDENGLTASSFLYLTGEYRLLTDLNSNLFVFTNAGFTEQKLFNEYDNDLPFGFGVGANFDTNAGIFSISYALGSEQGNAISLKQAKIHFGFKSLF